MGAQRRRQTRRIAATRTTELHSENVEAWRVYGASYTARVHEVHRRGHRRFEPRGTRLYSTGCARGGASVQAGAGHRNPQHLPLLLGCLRHTHVQPWRRCEERQAFDLSHRGRRRSSRQPRHAVPQRRGSAGFRQQQEPSALPGVSGAELKGVDAHQLGRCVASHREAAEGRPRPKLHCQDGRRQNGQSLDDDRHAGGLCQQQRSRLRDGAVSAWWDSTTRLVFDTPRRWQVLPRRTAVER